MDGTDKDMHLLGMKGAKLCNLFHMKIPVPLGFILTTEACQEFNNSTNHIFPKDHSIINEYLQAVAELERITGKQYGGKLYSKQKKNRRFPLLLSVRTAAVYPNPTRGLMNTILVTTFYHHHHHHYHYHHI